MDCRCLDLVATLEEDKSIDLLIHAPAEQWGSVSGVKAPRQSSDSQER